MRLSAHGAYHHEAPLVGIPKYRRRVLQGPVKDLLAQKWGEVREAQPAVESTQGSLRPAHCHRVAVSPPKDAGSASGGKSRANTSRESHHRFPELKQGYWRHEFWSVGCFASTVGIDEDIIRRDVEFQEKVDTGQLKLQLDFGFGSPVPRA